MSFTDNYISGYAPPAYAQYGYFQASVLPTTQNELRTIVIKGLPEDVKERELQNLCYFLPGFLVSRPEAVSLQPLARYFSRQMFCDDYICYLYGP